MLKGARAGSLLASFSSVDILVWLYEMILRVAPEIPAEAGRDRFVLSRVSATPALYAVLAERGFFDRDELWSYGCLGSLLQAAPDCRRTPGVDVTCGVLGMGAGIALGLALALEDSQPEAKVFCLLSAEEVLGGATWEALVRTIARVPQNLTLIIECAEMPSDSHESNQSNRDFDLLANRLSALGCDVVCADGHDYASLQGAWFSHSGARLRVIQARTVRGKGLPSLKERPLDDACLLEPQVTESLMRSLGGGLS